MPLHSYIFMPARDCGRRAASTPACRRSSAPTASRSRRPSGSTPTAVEQMTWAPGEPMLIEDRLIADGGWIERPGCTVFNLYRPPAIVPRAGDVAPWLDHVRKVYPDEADHIVLWLAHRVQRPHEKINHALVLGGKPGHRQGHDPGAGQAGGRAVELRRGVAAAGARPLQRLPEVGDPAHQRGARPRRVRPLRLLRSHEGATSPRRPTCCGSTKSICANTTSSTSAASSSPPTTRPTASTCRPTTGGTIVAWSNLTQGRFRRRLLAQALRLVRQRRQRARRRLPRQPRSVRLRPQGAAAEDAGLLGDRRRQSRARRRRTRRRARRPRTARRRHARSGGKPGGALQPAFAEWLRDRKNARRIPHRFEDCGYVAVRNPNDTEGRWKISGRRHTIYGKANLTRASASPPPSSSQVHGKSLKIGGF